MIHDAPQVYNSGETLPALRELFSQHPAAVSSGPEMLARMLHLLCFLNYRPEVCEVGAALETLRVEDEVLT
jgi:hypothetical protein